MKAEDKDYIRQQIMQKYPGTLAEMDIDWDMMEISFKAGEDQGYKNGSIAGYNEATQKAMKSCNEALVTGHKLGIREVVEFVEGNLIGGTENYIALDGRRWQAKLKGWGIR